MTPGQIGSVGAGHTGVSIGTNLESGTLSPPRWWCFIFLPYSFAHQYKDAIWMRAAQEMLRKLLKLVRKNITALLQKEVKRREKEGKMQEEKVS